MLSFYFVRHGESEANSEYSVSLDNVELTKLGENQAREVANMLKDKDIQIILASPLPRAQQTAQVISEELRGVEIETIENLKERNLGSYKGQPRPEAKNYFYDINDDEVESQEELIIRSVKVLEEIKLIVEQTEGKVLVVAHGILGFFMRNIAEGRNDYNDFYWSLKIGNAEVVEIRV